MKFDLYTSLWKACGISCNFGHETFPLQRGKRVAVIYGTQSVKLLEESASSLIELIEHHLTPFVVSLTSDSLKDLLRDGEIIRDVVWKDVESDPSGDPTNLIIDLERGPLALKYIDEEDEIKEDLAVDTRRKIGASTF
ncbi:hypothetical protein SAY87_023579 [Trapa incisa]|uniref:Uncharacterized protein n=1 Tax=Trapa incisa TaxID=236973 RepID=A0AAN7KSU2_9MYRT|nr:hypothetical protein SAY87_023579 [Trapa incisa]